MAEIANLREPDVCIVGAGPAGGILAYELARRGVRVVVVESGPRHDLAKRFDYMRRFLRGGNPWATPIKEIDRHTTAGNIRYSLEWARARGVGGSTLHWEGYTVRFHPNDFRLRSLYGVADDWPISYADLEPHYGRAEQALGIAGLEDDPWGAPRSTRFPLPAFPYSHSDRRFAMVCQQLGIAVHHLPQARNSVAYGGRPQCQACSTCHVCPTGAKASIDLTHARTAEETGNAKILADATALRLEIDGHGLAESLIYAGHDRHERRLSAGLFVIAGGAVETPRLLFLSASRRFPNGVGNESGTLGKHFMSHPLLEVTGRLAENVFPYRTGFSTAMSRQFAIDRDRARHGAFMLEFLNSAGPTPDRIAIGSGEWGAALRARVRDDFGHVIGIRIICEQLPDAANMVSLDKTVSDYFGNPVPQITYDLGAYERAAIDDATAVAKRILRAAGASDIETGHLWFAGHQMGTHRMGLDPRASVVDANLRVHDVPNVYLVGSGSFVSGSASPPTLTIAALAIRLAHHLIGIVRPSSPAQNRPALATPRTPE